MFRIFAVINRMFLSFRLKLALAASLLLAATLFHFLTRTLHSIWLTLPASPTPLIDPLHHLIDPLTLYLADHPSLKSLMTGIDGVLMDLSIFTTGAVFLLIARTRTAIITLVFFFIIRTLALQIVTFQNPDHYIFESPGVPSLFVYYGKVNDLYFSGHAGTTLILFLDMAAHGVRPAKYLFLAFFLYTVGILLVEQIHFLNDVIIGLVVGAFASRVMVKNEGEITLKFLEGFTMVAEFIGKLFGSQKRQEERIKKDVEEIAMKDFRWYVDTEHEGSGSPVESHHGI